MESLQTIEIARKNSKTTSFALGQPPACPFEMKHEDIMMVAEDGRQAYWYPNGNIIVKEVNDDVYYYYPKPTLETSIFRFNDGIYTRFYPDGSVEQRVDGICYIWGKNLTLGPVFKGKTFKICDFCHDILFADTELVKGPRFTYHCNEEWEALDEHWDWCQEREEELSAYDRDYGDDYSRYMD